MKITCNPPTKALASGEILGAGRARRARLQYRSGDVMLRELVRGAGGLLSDQATCSGLKDSIGDRLKHSDL